jgi:hypothetical protein
MYNHAHKSLTGVKMNQTKQKPGLKAQSMQGEAIRRNVLLDQISIDYYRKIGGGNISLGLRMVARRCIVAQENAY